MGSVSRKQLEEWLRTITVFGKVIDIGGSQNPLSEKRVENFRPASYKIFDLVQPHETKQKPDYFGDIQRIEDATLIMGGTFDQAFCLEVSEYWFNPLQALCNINYLLGKGGSLYISFHTLYGLHNPKGEDCLRYTKNAIEKLLEASNFKIIEMTPKPVSSAGMVSLEEFYKREGMRLDYSDMETYVEGYLVEAIKL